MIEKTISSLLPFHLEFEALVDGNLNKIITRSYMIVDEIPGQPLQKCNNLMVRRNLLIKAGEQLALTHEIPVKGVGWIKDTVITKRLEAEFKDYHDLWLGKKLDRILQELFERRVLEKEEINILVIKQSGRKDKLKQRDSGFNHVMAKIAKEKNVTMGINLDEIIHSDKKTKAKILGRVRQNVELCKKAKLKMMFFSEKENRNVQDLKAFGLVLGMPTDMLKFFE